MACVLWRTVSGVRIAHVSDCYAPRTGGIESQVRALAERQRRAGADVRVITATPAGAHSRAVESLAGSLTVHRVSTSVPFDLPIHPRTRREVGFVLDADPVDVLHVHAGVVSPFAWGAMRAARERGIPILVTVHSVWGPLARPAFGASDAIGRWRDWGVTLSAVSELAAARIRSAVPQVGEVLVLPNGIDADEWRPSGVDPMGGTAGELRLATVMRLAPRKRAIPLVRMIEGTRRALQGAVDVRATIVGAGPMLERAQRAASRAGIEEAVTFTGRLDRDGVREVLRRSDVYVQPSVKESFGLAALEARTAGLPVVVRSQSGSTQFITSGVEGLVADDDAGMVAALARLGRDAALRTRISEHNRTVPPRETWPWVLQEVDRAYQVAQSRAAAR
jgi:glycosyltransferase involved in cell wall biosynthesis